MNNMWSKMCVCFGDKEKNKSIGLLVLRITIALVFLLNGISKLAQHKELVGVFSSQLGLPAFLFWVLTIGEIAAGAMMLVGYMTNFASVIIAIIMIVAMIMVTFKGVFANPSVPFFKALTTGLFNSQLPIAMLGGAIALFFTGPGKYSLGQRCVCGAEKNSDCTDCKDGVCKC